MKIPPKRINPVSANFISAVLFASLIFVELRCKERLKGRSAVCWNIFLLTKQELEVFNETTQLRSCTSPLQILGHDIVSKMISTLRTSVETMLRVLTAGADADDGEGGKGNASFADMGTAIDAVVGGTYSIAQLLWHIQTLGRFKLEEYLNSFKYIGLPVCQ